MIHHYRTTEKQSERWVGGAVLIALGAIFLMGNFSGYYLHNWWALFILIPAIASFARLAGMYQQSGGELTPAMRGPLIGGIILTTIACTFIFNLSFTIMGPAILIIIGGSMLMIPSRHAD